jgi:deazaflavin-dependent oxidoreductase (nitroreductase family)
MPARNDALKEHLSRYREIKIMVTGRNSGRAISVPVWFVLDDEDLYLLPVQGSDTQWYKNVRKNPSIRINARGVEAEFNAAPVTDPAQVSSVVENFRHKYGSREVLTLGARQPVEQVARSAGAKSSRDLWWWGTFFRRCLDALSQALGLATSAQRPRPLMLNGDGEADPALDPGRHADARDLADVSRDAGGGTGLARRPGKLLCSGPFALARR